MVFLFIYMLKYFIEENIHFNNDNNDYINKDLLDNFQDENKFDEKNYFENLENLIEFNIISRHHKK